MKKWAVLAALCALTSGCAMESDKLDKSLAVYKECLDKHPRDLESCNGVRAAYEADLARYRALSAAAK